MRVPSWFQRTCSVFTEHCSVLTQIYKSVTRSPIFNLRVPQRGNSIELVELLFWTIIFSRFTQNSIFKKWQSISHIFAMNIIVSNSNQLFSSQEDKINMKGLQFYILWHSFINSDYSSLYLVRTCKNMTSLTLFWCTRGSPAQNTVLSRCNFVNDFLKSSENKHTEVVS